MVQNQILVTGANRGLGLGFTEYYLNNNCTVVACFRSSSNRSRLNDLKAEFAANLILQDLDVSQEKSIQLCTSQLAKQSFKFDIVINNAGVFKEENLGEWQSSTFETTFQVNSIGIALFSQAILPLITSNGKLINMSSGLGSIESIINPEVGFEAYAMSKAAVNMFTKRFAAKKATEDIIIVALSPGWVQTDMGGMEAPLTVAEAIEKIALVIKNLTLKDSGKFLSEEGDELPW
ncbi:MAG: SDR family oxidoreductase [Jejuia sp.]